MVLPFHVDLSHKIVAVTGGGGVLMSQFAEALALCGAKVAILDISPEAAEKTAQKIGKQAIAIPTDCLNKESVLRAKEIIEKTFGKVNYLINGAGGNNPRATCENEYMTADLPNEIKSFFDLEMSGLDFVFRLNITTAFLVTQVFAADMIESGGLILNISSMNAFRPLTKIPAYSAAKAGISNFTQWLAVHFAPVNIRVNFS
jgi:NAD(P)-dependent dehydrogenase (short-subunit alcohol dehydrogenase family)